MRLHFTKERLLEALEARRPWAKQLDKKQTAAHKAAERNVLQVFRARARASLKWNYEELRANGFEVGASWNERANRCPSSVVQELDQIIASIRLAADGAKIVVREVCTRGRWSSDDTTRIYWLLTHDENAKKDVCEV